MGGKGGVCAPIHVEYEPDGSLVFLWCDLLVLGQEVQEMDGSE